MGQIAEGDEKRDRAKADRGGDVEWVVAWWQEWISAQASALSSKHPSHDRGLLTNWPLFLHQQQEVMLFHRVVACSAGEGFLLWCWRQTRHSLARAPVGELRETQVQLP